MDFKSLGNNIDQIIANIASGVIVTDVQGAITTLNQAAERILAVKEEEAKGQPYVKVLPGLGPVIVPLINAIRQGNKPITGHELELELPHRGQVFLRLHVSPLTENDRAATGIAIVLEDLTERRQLEQQVRQLRQTLERYVAPSVVKQVLSDPASAQLGGVRREVTILFADIRDFVAFGEKVEPEFQIKVLNRHLALATEAVLAEEGTLDKFMGDCLMAIFNAPQPQNNHVLRAVRAALTIQQTISTMHTRLPPNERLSFGIGISTGQAVVGNIGSDKLHSYTAIGDIVNVAYLLQSHARPGQILMSAAAYECVREHVVGQELGFVQLKGHSKPDLVFEALGLREG
jgi:PAS domain S-box-containing protein